MSREKIINSVDSGCLLLALPTNHVTVSIFHRFVPLSIFIEPKSASEFSEAIPCPMKRFISGFQRETRQASDAVQPYSDPTHIQQPAQQTVVPNLKAAGQ
jgi:hypothetical protein